MQTTPDLGPSTRCLADLVRNIADDRLEAPTPCPDYRLGDLLDHVDGLSLAFTAAATKEIGGAGAGAPSGDASRLGPDWRRRIPEQLDALAVAWRDRDAWSGMTQAGGIELPGEVAGMVAMNEVVIHGWDVARASGQTYEVDEASIGAARGFLEQVSGPGADADEPALFGPPVEVPADAPPLDRLIGMSGRDPGWRPSS